MKIAEADILLIPGYSGAAPQHWVRRWQEKMATARVVEQRDWLQPRCKDWLETLVAAVDAAARPVVLVGHSLGAILIAHAAPILPKGKVRGAFLVAPCDWDRADLVPGFDGADFRPVPRAPLPFPARVVASRNDPYCDFAVARELALAWQAAFQDAGMAGHINAESGHGPWPEGLMGFAHFMKPL